jgi:predicted P-loop ATPase
MMAGGKVDTQAVLSGVDIVDVIDRYVPLKKSGAEYEACCPFHTEDTPSFKVSPAKQIFHCFGCGANGDAISFLRQHQGLSFKEAVEALGGRMPEAGLNLSPAQAVVREKAPRSQWRAVLPVPEQAPPPPRAHIKRGMPQVTWCYRDAEGRALGHVYRFVTSDGGKEVLPLVWAEHAETGAQEWHWLSFPEPRPLYGLDRLAAKPEATVLVVEGEKCADAAQAELPELVVVSWPGGGKAVKKADWSPLAGRKVMLWPDADAKRVPLTRAEQAGGVEQSSKPLLPDAEQPGHKTMGDVAEILDGLGCKLWSVAVPAAGEVPDGWDVADAIADGLTGAELADWIRAKAQPLELALAQADVGAGGFQEKHFDAAQAGAGEVYSGQEQAWRAMLLRKDDKLVDCRENVYLMLRHHPAFSGVVWVDDFARRIVKRMPAPWDNPHSFVPGGEWDENEHLRLGLWLAQQERMLVRSADNLMASIAWAATESRWHPVREYLDGLHWDGVERLGEWLSDFVGVRRSEYSALVGRYFLIGMVARIYEPGCAMRAMPILEGDQFKGKSTALRILGGEWFGDTPIDLNNKDAYQLIQGRWLYEIAELDAFNRADTTRIKSFISSPEDRFRAPYDRSPRDWKRQTVFAGTTNQDEYFKDQTGNTRYWPLRAAEVESINLDGLRAARDQLFAEAVALYKRSERWHPTRDEQQRLFEPEQASREIVDPWQGLIYEYLRQGTFQRITTTEILEDLMKVERSKIDGTRQMATRVGIAMKRVGWIKKRETDGSRGYFYARPAGWGVAGKGDEIGGGNVPF